MEEEEDFFNASYFNESKSGPTLRNSESLTFRKTDFPSIFIQIFQIFHYHSSNSNSF